MSDFEVPQSWLSRAIPTLIIEFFFFRFVIGCVDVDEDGSKTFITFHLDKKTDGFNLSILLYWLLDSCPFIGLSILPYFIGYLFWFPSRNPDTIE